MNSTDMLWYRAHAPEPTSPHQVQVQIPDDSPSYLPAPFPHVNTRLFGEIVAPSSMTELVRYLHQDVISFRPNWHGSPEEQRLAVDRVLWRGQADYRWRFDHGASRRLRACLRTGYFGHVEQRVSEYEDELLGEARLAGHGDTPARSLSDLELLTLLQHNGAATRLLDFSSNVFVALWFASIESPLHTGTLLGIRGARRLSAKQVLTQNSIADLLKDNGDLLSFDPTPVSARIRSQHSVFVFGRTIDDVWCSLPLQSAELYMISISPSLKKEAVNWCEKLLGYNLKTVYPDLSGFGIHHGARERLSTDILRAIDTSRRATEGDVFDTFRHFVEVQQPLPHPIEVAPPEPGPTSSDDDTSLNEPEAHRTERILLGDRALRYWYVMARANNHPQLGVWGHTRKSIDLSVYDFTGETLWSRVGYETRSHPHLTAVEVREEDERIATSAAQEGRIGEQDLRFVLASQAVAHRVDQASLRELTDSERHTLDETVRCRMSLLADLDPKDGRTEMGTA